MKRIAMISLHGDPTASVGCEGAGGQNVYVRELARSLAGAGTAVDVFTENLAGSRTEAESFGPSCRVVRIPISRPRQVGRHAFWDKLPGFLEKLEDTWPELPRYDLVHSHYWLAGWVGLKLAARRRLPLVHTSHSLGRVKVAAGFPLPDATDRFATEEQLARESLLVATNRREATNLANLYRARKVAIVPCGFDPRRFQPLDRERCRLEAGLDPADRVLLFVGRFDPNKGLAGLLRATQLLARRWNVQLVVIGGVRPDSPDKAEAQRIKELARDLGLEDRIRFLGAVDHARLGRYYSAADVTVVPSYYESFGLVALEAMACGSPVVASRTGGLACTIQDGENGILVEPGNVRRLAAAIARILSDPALKERLGSAGRERAFRSYTWPGVAQRMLAVYQDALESPVLRGAAR